MLFRYLIFAVAAAVLSAQDLDEDLFTATRKGDLAAVRALIEKGAKVNAKNRYGSTPLFFACDRGHTEVARLLIEKGATIDVEDTFYHATPLTWAMSKNRKDILGLLIEKGANPEAPLLSAIQSNNQENFDLVLSKGKASPQLLGEALYLAETTNRTPMADALKAKGAVRAGVTLNDEQLSKYAGKYQEAGSDASVTIAVKESALQFMNQGFSVKLLALGDHKFKYIQQGLLVTFIPGPDGSIQSARVPGRGGETTYKRVAVATEGK